MSGNPSEGSDALLRVISTSSDLKELTPDSFLFAGKAAKLAIAFVSPYFDFQDVVKTIKDMAGTTQVVAVSTSGELCAQTTDQPLYVSRDEVSASVVVQIYAADLIADCAIRAVPLFSEDLRAKKTELTREHRVTKIANHLRTSLPHFAINARDTLALTFFEGLTNSEDYFMEAVYETGLFPCPFAGGSAGTRPHGKHSYLFDDSKIYENHAVIVFLKLAPGKRYSILKSQNFRKTAMKFIAVDADPDACSVTTLLDPMTDTIRPAAEALAAGLGVPQSDLDSLRQAFSFGIEIDQQIFIRAVDYIDLNTGAIHFYANINEGDELFLVRPTDFATQTRSDIEKFLSDKPRPLGVLLNDCLVRRLYNLEAVSSFRNLWPCPVAGFSTLGELLGISINQTLTAIAFFDEADGTFSDPFIDLFPIQYAKYQDVFQLSKLRRIEVSTRLRADMTRRLTHHLGASPELANHIENMLDHSSNLKESLNSIHQAISREVASERRAARAEHRLLDAIEAMNEGFTLHDKHGRLIIINSRLREIYPLAGEKFVPGRLISDILTDLAYAGIYNYENGDRNELLKRRIDAHMNPNGKTSILQIGEKQWISSRLSRTRDGDVVCVRSDISEQIIRQMEIEKLKRSYELLLETAGDGIVGIDADGKVSFANPAASAMVKQAPEDIIGQDYKSVLGRSCLPAFTTENLQASCGECECIDNNGAKFTAEYILTPAFDDGVFTGGVLVFRDISLRKKYEASQQRLLGITSSLLEGVLLVDGNGTIVFANPSARRWLRTDDLLGKALDSVLTLEERGAAIPFADGPFFQVIETGQSLFNSDAIFILADGEPMNMAFSASLLKEGSSRRVAVISFRGIQALKDAQREAMQASRLASVGQLATGIAHEINTPIQYVGDNLHFIQDTFKDIVAAIQTLSSSLPEDQTESILDNHNIPFLLADYPDAIKHALQGVEHVSQIVRSMKDFSHPGTAAKVCLDINQAIESTVTVCRNEWKQIANMNLDLSPSIGKIQCYAADLNQVLLNLVINAAHAIGEQERQEKGNIYVSTRIDGEWLEIRIADDGPGVPEKLRERIFAPFFTTKAIGKGTGQGLSICQDIIVKKHEGQIYLDDTVQQGACFVVRLPAIECF